MAHTSIYTHRICVKYHSPTIRNGRTIIFTQLTIYHFKCLHCYFPLLCGALSLSLSLSTPTVSFPYGHFSSFVSFRSSSIYIATRVRSLTHSTIDFQCALPLCLAASNTCDGDIFCQCHIFAIQNVTKSIKKMWIVYFPSDFPREI